MPTDTVVLPSSSRRRPRRGSRRPARVLFHYEAVVAIHESSTTAHAYTRNREPIQVSFCSKRPPQPSTLFVHSSDLNHNVLPDIVCSVDDLLLLRVNMGRERFDVFVQDFDYFVYRANSSSPSLQLLEKPHPCFHARDVGILPRSDGHYIVAALNTTSVHEYELHLFYSHTSSWSSSMVSLQAPIPDGQILHMHDTSTVITIGGEGGTMGWVDLWHGILLCDVLETEPSLRRVPLPSLSVGIGDPVQRRGIAFIRGKGCLKFVLLEISDARLPGLDDETGCVSFRVDDWALTTWSNNVMSNSLEDWHKEYVIQASNITIADQAISKILEDSGLLRTSPKAEQRNLQNLSMYQPSPCLSGGDIVYLVAREKNRHPKAWMLAVDMRNGGRLERVAYFGIQSGYIGYPIIYRPSEISKYMNVTKYMNPATPPVDKGAGQNAEGSQEDRV